MKNTVQDRIKGIKSNAKEYKRFYKWIFQHAKGDAKKKTIPTDIAIQLWQIVFTSKQSSLPLLDKWLEFCEQQKEKDLKVVSKDVWEMIYDFLLETQQIENYDDAGGSWPIAVDEFVEWMQEG